MKSQKCYSNISKIIIVLTVAILGSTALASEISGTYENESYSFQFDSSFNEISGNWGQTNYDLTIEPDFDEVQGQVGSSQVDVTLSSDFHEAQGQTPCGNMDLTYSLDFKEITGTYCGQSYSQNFDSSSTIMFTFSNLVTQAILQNFPLPAINPAAVFITQRLKF